MDSPNLDFLRSSAVLMVLVFHLVGFFGIRQAGPFDLEAMGTLGVLLFFVHTSFVLMLSLQRQIARLGRQRFFRTFMVRRCFRIYPLSLFVVGSIVLLKLPLAGHPWAMHWPSIGWLDIFSNLFLIQNLTGSPSVLGPLWSLPFEMEVYILLPVLFLLVRVVASPWTFAAGWMVLTSALFYWVHTGHGFNLKYVPCFLPGILAYQLSLRKPSGWPFPGWPLLLCGSAALFMLAPALELGWLVCFVVGAAAPQFVEMKAPWMRRISQLIARYSYGIYLTHYFSLWLSFTRLRALPVASQWIIFIVTVVGLPIVLYHLLELPLINLGRRVAEKWSNLSPGPVLIHRPA